MANPEVKAYRASKFTIRLRGMQAAAPHKVAKIIFSDKDGSLFVSFPYFKHTEGLAAIATFPSGSPHAESIDLTEQGKVTSHLVKYSHHRDGRAHFSQAAKVFTAIKKASEPLNSYIGHLFTVQLQGLDAFQVGSGPDFGSRKSGDQAITLHAFGVEPRAVKILGHWFNRRELRQRVRGPAAGPHVNLEGLGRGVLISAPKGSPGAGGYLVLSASSVAPLSKEPGGHLTFAGGFDAPHVINDLSRATTFLALSYPAANVDELRRTIGSIDLPSKNASAQPAP